MKMIFRLKFTTCILSLLLAGCLANKQEKILPAPLFYVNFQNGTDSSFQGKALSTKSTEEKTFIDGVVGKALLCGKDQALSYALPMPLAMQKGSVFLWFKWIEPDDVSFLYLVSLIFQNERFNIYRYPHSAWEILALRQSKGNKATSLRAIKVYTDSWREKPEDWHNITVTWNSTESRLYLDGVMINSDVDFGKRNVKFDKINLGMQSVTYIDKGRKRINTEKKYAIDEVAVFDIVLSPEQICSLYETQMGKIIDKDDF